MITLVSYSLGLRLCKMGFRGLGFRGVVIRIRCPSLKQR